MKHSFLLVTVLIIFPGLITPAEIQAQQKNESTYPPCGKFGKIPNLTEEQQDKISKIRTTHLKVSNELRNKLKEKRAHLQTLTRTDNVNQKEVDATIDDITSLQNQLMKNVTKMRLEIRALLTDEQKVYFDSYRPSKRRKAIKK